MNDIVVKVGSGGAMAAVAGASTGAISASAIILATGGAAALVLVGAGVYCWLSNKK